MAIKDVWLRKKIYISTGSRCCKEHLLGKEFNQESMALIEGTQNHIRLTDEELVEWIDAITNEATRTKLPIDFNEDSKMSNEEYEVFTGLNRQQFDDLLTFCRADLRNSPCRTARNALAIFFLKLRLNLPQRILAYLFGITHKQRISDILRTVTKSLLKRVVPKYLGFNHISRQELASKHTSPFARKLYGIPLSNICLVIDATYLPVQKSFNHAEQLKLYSNHKHYHLCKPMAVTTDTCYHVAVGGPYYADNNNNDGKILKSMLSANSDFANFLDPDDILILDRGFRDSISTIEELNVKHLMPHFLKKKQKQFTTEEGNESRKCTKIRWQVEAAHGKIKAKFPIFNSVFPVPYFDLVGPWYQICCALFNKYFPPEQNVFGNEDDLADRILEQMNKTNDLQKEIEERGLDRKRTIWKEISGREIPDFPELSTEDLKKLTLGTYQIRMAKHYNAQHLMEDSCYKMHVCKDEENLVRAKIQSRFRKSEGHHVWIRYLPDGEGAEAILGWYCKCKNGARTVGMCSHICSVRHDVY